YKSPATRPVEAGWYWDSKGLVWDTRAVLQPTRDIHVTYELKLWSGDSSRDALTGAVVLGPRGTGQHLPGKKFPTEVAVFNPGLD
ncbi:hypothetical protein, partial [Parachitinimonas caeni]